MRIEAFLFIMFFLTCLMGLGTAYLISSPLIFAIFVVLLFSLMVTIFKWNSDGRPS